MSDRIETREDMNRYLKVMEALNKSTDDYFFLWDLEYGRVHILGGIHERYGLRPCPQEGYTIEEWKSIVYKRDLPAVSESLDRIEEGRDQVYDMEYRLMDKKDRRIWISCRGDVHTDQDGRPLWMTGRVSDKVLGLKVDPLTGMLNSGKFSEDMDECLERGHEGYLLVFGIDNFKDINIRHGRGFGNHILKMVSEALEDSVDLLFHIYRLDGDRFAVNLSGRNREDTESVFEAVRQRVKDYCTLSAGAASYSPDQRIDGSTLYQYGESALDHAKRGGKDTLIFFQAEDYEERLSQIQLQEELRRSIQNGFQGFSLCYQPQIRMGDYMLWGAEALLRYTSSSRGPVPPDEFIPLLEQSELICQTGQWALKTALEQCRCWRQWMPQFHISVNISYVQLRQKGVTERVLELLAQSGLPGEALTLEVTESMQLHDYQYFNRIFYQWEHKGIQIAIDDFGTGYSSLSYLKSIEAHEIKIDRCFVSRIRYSAYNYRLLSNMIELARSAQIRVCCEGVETEDELEVLKELHPDTLQGYLFGKPCSREHFEEIFFQSDTREYQARQAVIDQLREDGENGERLLAGQIGREELSVIVEGMDEIIYVSDLDTYDLYYLNPAGRRLTGMYDYKGRKCYQVLQGREGPCEFCTNQCLRRDEFHVWETQNRHFNRHFIVKDKLIPWCGRQARLEIAIDVTEKEIVSQSVREKLDFEKNVVECTKMLVEEPDIAAAAQNVLAFIGEFYRAERAYIFEPRDGGGYWDNTYEWCREGAKPQQEIFQKMPARKIRRWLECFDRESSVIIDDVADLRKIYPEEWELLATQDIDRLMVAPVWKERQLIGFIGVDNPECHSGDDALIHTMAYFLADRISRYETEERLNELLDCRYEDILKITALGLWIIRMDLNTGYAEMYADRTMREVMGLEYKVSPQECYNHWYSRINDGYYHYVNQVVENMIESRRITQLEYTWNHPIKGEVVVRCLGTRVEDSDGMICLQGYHRIISEMEKPRFLHDGSVSEMFEFNEKRQSVYFHTGRELLAGDQMREEDFPQCWIRSQLVHPQFAGEFQALFTDVDTKDEVHGMEFLLKNKQGAYEWFKIRTRRLGREKQDVNTIVVILDPASQERMLELEYMRKNDFYEAMLSETVAYAEVDVEKNQLKASGGLWSSYIEECRRWGETFTQVMERNSRAVVMEEDQELCFECLRADAMRAMHQEDNRTRKVNYRRMEGDTYRWMELVIHVFQERFTEKTHGLLYLKDIDVEKRRALAQEREARQDPLTNVYNRRTFEREVILHMAEKGSCGALIVVDLDNFKQINDAHGHLEGDRALKRLTEILVSVFRRKDLIGRLGGDEFLIFLRDMNRRDILDRRMEALFEALRQSGPVQISCSAGIALLEQGEKFSYEECFEKADAALYRSKQMGKNTYCYYEAVTSGKD